jgi:hypothetical protein
MYLSDDEYYQLIHRLHMLTLKVISIEERLEAADIPKVVHELPEPPSHERMMEIAKKYQRSVEG